MGVNIFILDRRPARLAVAGVEQDVGSLRRFWKITELDEERSGELSASEAAASAIPSPKAAIDCRCRGNAARLKVRRRSQRTSGYRLG